MRRFLRILSLCALLCCFAAFALIGYAGFALPDEFCVMSGDAPKLPDIYSVSYDDTATDGVCVSLENDDTEETVNDARIMLLDIIPVKTSRVTTAQRSYVVPLGMAFGIKLYTRGVVIVKTDEVMTNEGAVNPAQAAGLRAGDIILKVNGVAVAKNTDVSNAFAHSGGKELTVKIDRDGQELDLTVTPALSAVDGRYKVGVWVRDSSAGIGTLTFFDSETDIFAGLGHAVCDVDTGEVMPLSGGEAVEAEIRGSYRGESGAPGELCGVFKNDVIGKLLLNGDTGVYGKALNIKYSRKKLPVAMSYEITTGAAQIISEVDRDGAKAYDVEITKIYPNADSHQKNMVVRVTDSELIAKTGGIVQGMSGSPIIQNGMFVGAVTHVFVNNPLQGYAVFSQNMVETARGISDRELKMAS